MFFGKGAEVKEGVKVGKSGDFNCEILQSKPFLISWHFLTIFGQILKIFVKKFILKFKTFFKPDELKNCQISNLSLKDIIKTDSELSDIFISGIIFTLFSLKKVLKQTLDKYYLKKFGQKIVRNCKFLRNY